MRTDQLAAIPLLCTLAMFGFVASNAHAEHAVDNAPFRFESVSSDPIEHGERLSAVLGCIGCHLTDLTGDDWTDPDLGVLWTANLTQSVAEYSKDELIVMITEGKRPDRPLMDMPSFLFSQMHPEDISALVSYLKTVEPVGEKHPEPTIGPQLAKDIESGEFKDSVEWVAEMKNQGPPDMGPEHAYGRFIVRATCVECHGMDLEGSDSKITDAATRPTLRIVAAYSKDDFATLMETGKPLGDRELTLMGGVSRWRYSRFTDREFDAVYNYLVAFSQSAP